MSARASDQVTQRSGTSFAYAFRILPRPKREAMHALYAFCRTVDDCVDEADGEGEAGLVRWLEEVDRCYAGRPETPLGRDLAEAVGRFPIPRSAFGAIVDGCRMDLTITRYASAADLRVYCERVASAVGLASIEIFGYRNPQTRDYAVELGVALQLTNILRDVATDAARGRLYLPLEDLRQHGVTEADVLEGRRTPEVARLMEFEGRRAREHYRRAAALLPEEDRRAMVAAEIMGRIYQRILDTLEERAYPIGPDRVRVSTLRKAAIAIGTWAGF